MIGTVNTSKNMWRNKGRLNFPIDGLVLYAPLWHPELNADPFISKDLNAYSCDVTGATWGVQGRTFDGTDFIQIGDTTTFKWLHGALDTSSFQFTVELWMQLPTPEPDTYYGIIATCSATAVQTGFYLAFDDRSAETRSRRFAGGIVRGSTGNPVLYFSSADNVYPNNTDWHHIALTYDQSLASANAVIYVDGVAYAMGNKTANTPSTGNSTNELHIGSLGDEAYDFVGSIGEVFIYNRALSSVEVINNNLSTKWRY